MLVVVGAATSGVERGAIMRRSLSGVAVLVALGTGLATRCGHKCANATDGGRPAHQLAGAAGCVTSTRVAGCTRVAVVCQPLPSSTREAFR
jgi:hypothetical protein